MPIFTLLPYRALFLAWLVAFAVLFAPSTGHAQAPTAQAQDAATVDAQQIEALVKTLEDPAARDRFLTDLKALQAARAQLGAPAAPDLVEPEEIGAGVIFAISAGIRALSENILEAVSVLNDLPGVTAEIESQLTNPETRDFWLWLTAELLLVLACGYIAEWIVGRSLARPSRRIEGASVNGMLSRLLLTVARVALDLLPIAAFAAATYSLLPFLAPEPRVRYVLLAVINAHIVVRLVLAGARLFLMPAAANLRVPRISGETANYLYLWIRRLAAVMIYGYFFAEALRLLGLSAGAYQILLKLIGLATTAMLLLLIVQNRKPVSDWLRGKADAGQSHGVILMLRRRLADVWHVIAGLYIIASYAIWMLGIHDGFVFLLRATVLTLLVIAIARLAILAVGRAVERLFHVGQELTLRYPGLEARANRYLPVFGKILRGLVYGVAALFILQAWGVESLVWLTSPIGLRFVGTGLSILVILGLALAFWEMSNLGLDRYAARIDATSRSSARVRTLLPLLRTIILAVLCVMVGLVVLSEIGVNITPLLAGAGVIGLAVGFGSQKLVQDIINGLFILAEDTISVGDVVNLDGQSGLVEGLTVRYIRLRDFAGNVITMPFSEVKTVINMTRDYSRYVFDIGIAYKEDVDQVIDVLKGLDEEMRQDERFAPLIIAPLEIIGLDKFADSAVIVKARYTTLPIKQWEVGREFNRRIKKRFDELGIEIPFPHLTLYHGDAPPAKKDGQAALPAEPQSSDGAASQSGKPTE